MRSARDLWYDRRKLAAEVAHIPTAVAATAENNSNLLRQGRRAADRL
jgi:hypothetical protein